LTTNVVFEIRSSNSQPSDLALHFFQESEGVFLAPRTLGWRSLPPHLLTSRGGGRVRTLGQRTTLPKTILLPDTLLGNLWNERNRRIFRESNCNRGWWLRGLDKRCMV
jgi:hypothetical protein